MIEEQIEECLARVEKLAEELRAYQREEAGIEVAGGRVAVEFATWSERVVEEMGERVRALEKVDREAYKYVLRHLRESRDALQKARFAGR